MQIANPSEVSDIERAADEVASKWVDPVSAGSGEINGLVYGLVQSGKTGVLTASAAIAIDSGYKTIIVLTSDIDPLYVQTLGRVREALPGADIIGKSELRDRNSFAGRIRAAACAIVITKNARLLSTLIQNLKASRLRLEACLIIDDEADQASLNTRALRDDGTRSTINTRIDELRGNCGKSTYLQVTATPQALFLQSPGHAFRPKFTVLSHPGADYVGGDEFFGASSNLVREFDLNDIADLAPGAQPAAPLVLPRSLMRALDLFIVGATYKRMLAADQNCSFLCHVSTRTSDHRHIEQVLRKYKSDLADGVRRQATGVIGRLRAAYDDLSATHPEMRGRFEELVGSIGFLIPGAVVKIVNGESDEDVAVHAPYNVFVGGNKLGRGVTIRNLLVSYYGRNPRRPQADTVLQHARMYGYRRSDIGLLRLFLPPELHAVFRGINDMERGLRELIAAYPSEDFRGMFVPNGLNATRGSVLAPGAVGIYSGGRSYNPSQVQRGAECRATTERIDRRLVSIVNKTHAEVGVEEARWLMSQIRPELSDSDHIWNSVAISESIAQSCVLRSDPSVYVYVDRERDLRERRRETQGILDSGESGRVPSDKVCVFMLRTVGGRGRSPVWWPQVRFPAGAYGFAFAI